MGEILSVKTESLSSVADSIRKKTGKNEKLAFPADFVSEIEGIKGGGETPTVVTRSDDMDVLFFDYDGTLVAAYTEDEARALTELPTPPAHDGLTFQGWNYTLDEVHQYADAADVGAMYVTSDGATKMVVTATEGVGVRVIFDQSNAEGVAIDWGDGTVSQSPVQLSASASHTYDSTGTYTISLLPDDDCTIKLGAFAGSACIAGAILKSAHIGKNVPELYPEAFSSCYYMEHISMSETVYIKASAFRDCWSLTYLTVPRATRSLFIYVLQNCFSMRHVSFPPVLGIVRSAMSGCYSMRRLILIGSYSTMESDIGHCTNNCSLERVILKTDKTIYLGKNMFSNCNSLKWVDFRCNVSKICSGAMQSDNCLQTVDLSNCTVVPTLEGSGGMPASANSLEILVPLSLESQWRAATNWTTYASKIKGV